MSFDKIAAVFITGAAGSTCEQPFEDIIVLDRQDSFTQTSPDDNSARGVVTVEFESRAWWAGRQEDSSRKSPYVSWEGKGGSGQCLSIHGRAISSELQVLIQVRRNVIFATMQDLLRLPFQLRDRYSSPDDDQKLPGCYSPLLMPEAVIRLSAGLEG